VDEMDGTPDESHSMWVHGKLVQQPLVQQTMLRELFDCVSFLLKVPRHRHSRPLGTRKVKASDFLDFRHYKVDKVVMLTHMVPVGGQIYRDDFYVILCKFCLMILSVAQ
jgi:hypothetical protein